MRKCFLLLFALCIFVVGCQKTGDNIDNTIDVKEDITDSIEVTYYNKSSTK